MKINKLVLRNFRNHKNLKIEFNSEITLIKGNNGSGKTNILEAIYLLSFAKSPKAKYDRDMINHDAEFCTVSSGIQMLHDELELEVKIIKDKTYKNASEKKLLINKVPKSQKYFNKQLFTVLFSPEDISILTGTPSERRKYMDIVLGQIDYDYKKTHSDYTKSLRQRNKILEMISETSKGIDQLDFWTDRITLYGQIIQEKREALFNFISRELDNNALKLKGNLRVNYSKSILTKERLDEYKHKEIYAKTTLIGPHRDDFSLDYQGHDIGEFGSRGQQRSAILALKLSEIEFVKEKGGERPVLLLDDIFSELDSIHRKDVLDLIHKQQTIITTAEEIDIPEKMLVLRL